MIKFNWLKLSNFLKYKIRAVNNYWKRKLNNLKLFLFLWHTTGQVIGMADLAVLFGGFRHIWRKFNDGPQRTGVIDLAQILKI